MVTEPAAGPSVTLVLLASPLLGPAVWAPVAGRLTWDGWVVVVPPAPGAVTRPDDVLAGLLAAIPDEPVILVPHSNAGLYVAAIAAARDVRGIVFVDAGVPDRRATTPTAPAAFREFLAGLVDDDGLLPVWTRWWSSEDLEGVFPDAGVRAAVESEQARLPLAYFDADVPSPAGWDRLPTAFLAFGDTYAAERDRATERGWPATTLPGAHLHQLVDPDGVAAALTDLIGRLGLRAAE